MASGQHPLDGRRQDRPGEGIWSSRKGKLGHTGICGPQRTLSFLWADPVAATSHWSSCNWWGADIGYQLLCWQLSVRHHLPLHSIGF
ncbi:hypothetical protein NQZ68_007064 [Dissostichus eleginoides]|nr:hypothetical protein NQZ68_007064 [Dissostichus eleginoides]